MVGALGGQRGKFVFCIRKSSSKVGNNKYYNCKFLGAKMGLRIRFFLALVFSLLFVGAGVAQQRSAETDFWGQINKLDWKFGPTQGNIGGIASLSVPNDSVFLSSIDTRRFLELQGNLGSDGNYTFAPKNLSWFSVFSFDESGYVKDDEKIDPNELLAILKKSNASTNEERRRRGIKTLTLEDWYVAPHYDVQTKRLEWATKLRGEAGDITVNYTVRLFGPHRSDERNSRFRPVVSREGHKVIQGWACWLRFCSGPEVLRVQVRR